MRTELDHKLGPDVVDQMLSGNATKVDFVDNMSECGRKILGDIVMDHKTLDKLFKVI